MSPESASLLEYVLECLTVPVSVHDPEGAVVYQNAAHEQLFGARVGCQFHPVFKGPEAEGYRRTLEVEGQCVAEERLGGGRVATLRVVRLPDGEGHLVEVVGVATLEPAHTDMETFVQTAAHDLKTPLVSIKGYAELLQRELGAEGGRAPTFLERLLIQAHRMENLLEELLDYARIGSDEAELRSLDLTGAARSAWHSLQDLAEPVGARLEIDEPLPRVRCSPMRLQQVLVNLLNNAIRYRRDGVEPRLRLARYGGSHAVETEHGVFVLQDNGVGVPDGEREAIFALFHRANQSCVGTGVGLAIVRRIVEGGGGEVWVEPVADGPGSRFVFSLPLALEESP